MILEDEAPIGRPQAGGIQRVLDPDRQTVQGPERLAAHDRSLAVLCGLQCSLEVASNHCVHGMVDRFDAANAALRQLDGRQLLGSDHPARLRRIEIAGRGG